MPDRYRCVGVDSVVEAGGDGRGGNVRFSHELFCDFVNLLPAPRDCTVDYDPGSFHCSRTYPSREGQSTAKRRVKIQGMPINFDKLDIVGLLLTMFARFHKKK